jgi:hypothetical protein
MEDFLDMTNRQNLFNFVNQKYKLNINDVDFQTQINHFAKSFKQTANNQKSYTMNDLNQSFLENILVKKSPAKRRLVNQRFKNNGEKNEVYFVDRDVLSGQEMNQIPVESISNNPYFQPQISYDLKSYSQQNSSSVPYNNNLNLSTSQVKESFMENEELYHANYHDHEQQARFRHKQNNLPNPNESHVVNSQKNSFMKESDKNSSLIYSNYESEVTEAKEAQAPGKREHEKGSTSVSKHSIFSKQFELMDRVDFDGNSFVPLGNQPDSKNGGYQNESIYVLCNSRDRDVTKFPFHDYFQVQFSSPIKNIIEIKCENIILPNLNYFEFEPYLFLQVTEIDQLFQGSSNMYSKMFAQILPCHENPIQKFITCFPAKTKKKFYNNPLASLSRLSFRLCTSNGNPLPLSTDVFQIIQIENTIYESANIYKITLMNQPRNQNLCFYKWLKESCHIYDPIFITGIPEIRQQLYYLDFDDNIPVGNEPLGVLRQNDLLSSFELVQNQNIVLYASPLKITNVLFSDLNFNLLQDKFQHCFCSFNKMSVSILLKFKILNFDNKIIYSQIVK